MNPASDNPVAWALSSVFGVRDGAETAADTIQPKCPPSEMNAVPTDEQIRSLPVWAQRYIDKLQDDISVQIDAKNDARMDCDELRSELSDLRRRRH